MVVHTYVCIDRYIKILGYVSMHINVHINTIYI